MKTITMYECELCGTRYRDQEECLECEKYHLTDLQIKRVAFDSKKVSDDGLPKILEIVSVATEQKAQYKREF